MRSLEIKDTNTLTGLFRPVVERRSTAELPSAGLPQEEQGESQ